MANCKSAFLFMLCVLGSLPTRAHAEGWQAGTARVAITPKTPTWMAGYAARKGPSEGVIHDLWAKALVLKDARGNVGLLVTIDVCGVDRALSARIRDVIQTRHKLDRSRVVLACSHTHCGPVVGHNLLTMYKLDDAQAARVREYTEEFVKGVLEAADKAFERLEPVELAWGRGLVDFAVNRRENAETKVAELRGKLALKGPVDHDVPVLRVRGGDGKDKAIVFGYACHCTVLDLNKLCGDYAGFAQIAVEKAHPEAQAMFVAGCGADQNPQPRRQLNHAEQHGRALAGAVDATLAGPLRPIAPNFSTAYEEIPLAFDKLPTAAEVEAQTKDANFFIASRARMLRETIAAHGKLSPTYPYPVQVWNLGEGEVTWIFLGGEVVVDYALRIKRNIDPAHAWITAYANDVMAYIPSLRVLKEGGYEGATAMIYYARPAPWSTNVEEDIMASIARLLKKIHVLK